MTQQWGCWRFSPAGKTLLFEREGVFLYAVDLETCTTARGVLDWIFQVNGKKFATPADVGDLIRALDEILAPQSTLCGNRQARARRHQRHGA